MKKLIAAVLFLFISSYMMGQAYQIGDEVEDFNLLNIDGAMVSMADFPDTKGFVVIFTCNHCPFAIAWEDRIIAIDKEYGPKGYPVIAINPNDSTVQPKDSYTKMIERAEEKGFTFPYLLDAKQEVYPKFGATRTPHVFIVNKEEGKNILRYIGAIDDNYEEPENVKKTYTADAIDALLKGSKPDPDFTKAVGCSIKKKKG